MTIADYGSHRSASLSGRLFNDAEDFATLAIELEAARDLNQILADVLEFALTRMSCVGAAVHVSPAGRQLGTTMTSHPQFTVTSTDVDSSQPGEVAPRLMVDLTDGRSTVGTIAFCPAQPDGFSTHDITTAHLIAVHASLAIAAIRTTEDLSAAIEAHTIIGQALGIMMERCAIDADTAFAVLRRWSQDNNTRLQEVARSLITTRRLPGKQDGPARMGVR